MAATYALTISATSSNDALDFKKPTYGHMNYGFLKQKLVINSAIFGTLALKRTLEKLIELQESGNHDETIESAYFQKFYNPPIVRMFNPYYNEDDDFIDFDPWDGFSKLLMRQTFIDFCLIQTQRWYEDLACLRLPVEVSRKLCGEIKQIAIDAGEKHGRLSAAGIVFKASMESKLLFCSAGLTLSVTESLCKILIWGQPKGLSTMQYVTYHIPVEIFKRVGVRLFVMSVGAAVGTLIKPGIGTTMTVLVIDFVSMPILYGAINRAAGIR
jgi:hypothetical protein